MGVLTKKNPKLSAEENHARHMTNFEGLKYATFQDVRIWQRKARIDNPLVTESSGPNTSGCAPGTTSSMSIGDKIEPQSVAHFEKEVDTGYANEEVWAKEIADSQA